MRQEKAITGGRPGWRFVRPYHNTDNPRFWLRNADLDVFISLGQPLSMVVRIIPIPVIPQ